MSHSAGAEGAAPGASDATESRVAALLDRLPFAHRLGQLIMAERATTTPDHVREAGIGAVLSGGGSAPGDNTVVDWVAMHDAYWRASMDTSGGRTAVPVLYAIDSIHGNANVRGATVLPHNIGLGATRDPSLVERLARVCAREILATGLDWNFAPTLAVAGNPRWGRVYESFGDDPSLVASFAAAYVRGLQGALGDDGVIACAKHWLGDGGTMFGEDQGNTVVPEAELIARHAAPYVPAIEAGVATVMASFNSWNGEKCHGSRTLLTDWLRGRYGFDGLVVSDWDGVDQLDPDLDTAVARAVNAGVDMIMVSGEWQRILAALERVVADGRVPMARIDEAAARVLRLKVRAGTFERAAPALRPFTGDPSFGSAAHRAVAREAVRKSLVLLKHERDLLPLRRDARVLVAGKGAHDRGILCGGFTISWQGMPGNAHIEGGTSVWEGIRAVAPSAVLDPDGASADAARHDVAVVVIGERPYAEGAGDIREGDRIASGSGFHGEVSRLTPYGRTLELSQLHPEDLATITRIRSAGVPVVAVYVAGRPLVVNAELDASDAFVAAWLPGSEGGGIADVLFGDAPFTGRLPAWWPARDALHSADMGQRFPLGFGLTLG